MLTVVSASADASLSTAPTLQTLEAEAVRIESLERSLAAARSSRDQTIKILVERGVASERAAATAASVSPGYAHRAVKHGRFARRMRS